MNYSFPSKKLISWFLSSKRPMPWRENPTPYKVWISEIMLQQTQVKTVIPYFNKWMLKFPDIVSLTNSSLDEVIKAWEGLGYYSRARNIHLAAKQIIKNHHGTIPSTYNSLKEIKGLGPYTIGAILSFAFHLPATTVDGNVMRVLARFYALNDDIAKLITRKKITTIAEEILPNDDHWIFNEALIELGATICNKNPQCHICPLKHECLALRNDLTTSLPIKKKATKIQSIYRTIAVIQHNQELLMMRRKEGGLMQDLYEFPYFEQSNSHCTSDMMKEKILDAFNIRIEESFPLKEVVHCFTRFRAKLKPYLFTTSKKIEIKDMIWANPDLYSKKAFSSGHKKILKQI